MKLFRSGIVAVSLFFPGIAFAETTLQEILITIGNLINTATPIIVAFALVAFFWGLAMYLFGVGDGSGSAAHAGLGAPATAAKRDGRSMMITGVLVFFVMLSIWGLVNILQATFKVNPDATIKPPKIDNPYSKQM